MLTLINKLNKRGNLEEIFCYILIFINFMGVNFLKISIRGINFNLGRALMIVTMVLLIIHLFKGELNKKIKERSTYIKQITNFLVIWSLFSLFSLFRSKAFFSTIINEFFMIFGTTSILILLININNTKKLINIFKAIEIAMIANTIYALFLYYTGHRVYGGFYYNVNDLATFFLIGVPVQCVLLTNLKTTKFIKIVKIISIIIEIYVFNLLDSRACSLGVIIGILGILLIAISKRNTNKIQDFFKIIKKNKRNSIVVGVIFITIILISAILIINNKFQPQYTNLDSINVRINLIYNGFEFFKQHMFLGIGSGNMDYYMQNYAIYPTNNITSMHNYWMEILVNYGIVIFIIFCICFLKTIIEIMKKYMYSKTKEESSICIMLLFFLIAFIIGSISSSNNMTKEWLWLLAGIIISYINITTENSVKEDEEDERKL